MAPITTLPSHTTDRLPFIFTDEVFKFTLPHFQGIAY